MTSHSDLTVQTLSSPVGALLLAWNERGLHAVIFADLEVRRGGFQRYLRRHGLNTRAGSAALRNPYATALKRYFKGDLNALEGLTLAMLGTPFQLQVWTALRAIPVGSTTSYGALANSIGRPGAQRAVGTANGQNPVAIIVPCHRVIGSTRKLTGYGGGLDNKRWLLEHEKADVRSQSKIRRLSADSAGLRPA